MPIRLSKFYTFTSIFLLEFLYFPFICLKINKFFSHRHFEFFSLVHVRKSVQNV